MSCAARSRNFVPGISVSRASNNVAGHSWFIGNAEDAPPGRFYVSKV
jgi:hypothetical protein